MNIEFINNAYTVDRLMLPMVHFQSKEKNIGFYLLVKPDYKELLAEAK